MSFFPAKDPVLRGAFSCDAIDMAIVARISIASGEI
jgi:hypothetical protein